MREEALLEIIKCNREAFDCVANLEAFGYLDPGALLGLKNWLSEQSILLSREQERMGRNT